MHSFDVVIIGAGAAGLFCAGIAGQLGLKVLLVDHTDKVAEKIRISGGGRCNFTNLTTAADNFLGQNPKFCRSALAGYRPGDFIDLVRNHEIGYHEKHKGQLFCDDSAQDLITMLLTECGAGGVVHWQNCPIHTLATEGDAYLLGGAQGAIRSRAVVVATGGLSIPKIGATDFGYRIARQFGLPVLETRPALVPLVFEARDWTHGVLVGAAMGSETTAAATGAIGVMRRDPMAMKPFCGYNFADYFAHWLSFDQTGANLPKVFHVNWFRKGDDGTFLWPGFGDNLRVLEWMIKRVEGTAGVQETPIGSLPVHGELNLDGLDLSDEARDKLFGFDQSGWQAEFASIGEYLQEYGSRMPEALHQERSRVSESLTQAP